MKSEDLLKPFQKCFLQLLALEFNDQTSEGFVKHECLLPFLQ